MYFLNSINLKISDSLKNWISDFISSEHGSGFEPVILKGQMNDSGPDVWTTTVLSESMLEDIISSGDFSRVEIEGFTFTIHPKTLMHELEGKYMDFGDNGPILVDMH